jgi:hypothetical protein
MFHVRWPEDLKLGAEATSHLLEAVRYAASLFEFNGDCTLHLSTAALGSDQWYAKFDAQRSDHCTFYIELNHHWLISQKYKPQFLSRVLLHEMVHALDYRNIADTRAIYQTHKASTRLLLNPKSHELFWRLSYFFSLTRNEGLALYAENLFFEEVQEHTPIPSEFTSDVTYFLNCHPDSMDHDSLVKRFDQVYLYAGDLFLHLFGIPSKEHRAQRIQQLMKMDLSEWAWLTLTRLYPPGLPHFLSLLSKFTPFQSHTAWLFKEKDHFTSYLKTLKIPPKPKIPQRQSTSVNLERIIQAKITDLQSTLGPEHELFPLVLGYLQIERDLIPDDLPFLGLLDDWCFVDRFCKLVN